MRACFLFLYHTCIIICKFRSKNNCISPLARFLNRSIFLPAFLSPHPIGHVNAKDIVSFFLICLALNESAARKRIRIPEIGFRPLAVSSIISCATFGRNSSISASQRGRRCFSPFQHFPISTDSPVQQAALSRYRFIVKCFSSFDFSHSRRSLQ